MSNFMKIRPVGSELFYADEDVYGHTELFYADEEVYGHTEANNCFLQFCQKHLERIASNMQLTNNKVSNIVKN
jgi:hypothetical protein